MKDHPKTNPNLKTAGGLAFVIFMLLLAGGCGKSSVTRASATDLSVDTALETDAEISSALSAVNASPNNAAGYTRLAAIYIKRARQTGDFSLNSKASTAIEDALKAEPSDITARKLQASISLTFHQFSKALELGQKLQNEFPDDAFGYGVLTDANAELGNYDEAVNAAQRMVDMKPNTASYARVGHLRSLYGDHKGSIKMLTLAARTADPNDKEAQSWCLVQIGDEEWKGGDFKAAEEAYDEALEILPNYYLALTGKGRILAVKGDLDSAANILADAQNRIPNVETIILLGDVYTKLGKTDEADNQSRLVEVVEQKLGLVGDQKRLAQFWADRNMRLGEALEIAEREYQARKDIYTADIYGWCLLKNGRSHEAADVMAEALRLKTGDARLYYHAGMIQKAEGNRREAKRLLTLALKTNPGFDLLQSEIARHELETL